MAIARLSFTRIAAPETGECTICLFPLSGRKIVVQHAGDSGPMHPFHAGCIAQIAASVCPVCRAPVDLASIGTLESQKEKVTRYIWQSARHIAFAGGTTAVVLGLHRFFEQCEGGNRVQFPQRVENIMEGRHDLEGPFSGIDIVVGVANGIANRTLLADALETVQSHISRFVATRISRFINIRAISPIVIYKIINICLIHIIAARTLGQSNIFDVVTFNNKEATFALSFIEILSRFIKPSLITHLLPLAIITAFEHYHGKPLNELIQNFLEKMGFAEEPTLGFDRENWTNFLSEDVIPIFIDLICRRHLFSGGEIYIGLLPKEALNQLLEHRINQLLEHRISECVFNESIKVFVNWIVWKGHVQEFNMPVIKLLYKIFYRVGLHASAGSLSSSP